MNKFDKSLDLPQILVAVLHVVPMLQKLWNEEAGRGTIENEVTIHGHEGVGEGVVVEVLVVAEGEYGVVMLRRQRS